MSRLFGRRVMLRPLVGSDFMQWSEVRLRNRDWLLKWEPMRIPGTARSGGRPRGVRGQVQRPPA